MSALNCKLAVAILGLGRDEDLGPSRIGSLTVRLTTHPDEPVVKGKQRILSELKEDTNSKLEAQLPHPEVEGSTSTSTSSQLYKSLNRMLSGLSALSKVMDGASKVRCISPLQILSLTIDEQIHPHIDTAWGTITLLRKVDCFLK